MDKSGVRKTAVFGGTFDPFHSGHLHFVEYVLDLSLADVVFIVPAFHPPHKDSALTNSFSQRKKIIRMVLEKSRYFRTKKSDRKIRISSVEKILSAPGYTYKTMEYFARKFPGDNLFLMLGMDSYSTIGRWAHSERISSHQMIIAGRGKIINEENSASRIFLDNPFWDFSSTGIKQILHEYRLRRDPAFKNLLIDSMGENATEYIIKEKIYE